MYRGGLAIGFAVTQFICALTAITFNSLAIQQRKDDYDSVDCFYGEYHWLIRTLESGMLPW